MNVSFLLMVQEIATMKCFKENYLDFMTKLLMDNMCAPCVLKARLSNEKFLSNFLVSSGIA